MDTQSQRYLKQYKEWKKRKNQNEQEKGGRCWADDYITKSTNYQKEALRVFRRVKVCLILEGWPQGKKIRKQKGQASYHEVERALWPALRKTEIHYLGEEGIETIAKDWEDLCK